MERWHILIPVLLCGAVLEANSPKAGPEPISFTQARTIILEHNYGLKSAKTESEAVRTGVAQANVYQNPGIALDLDKFGINEIEATIEQTVELGGKRKLRTEIARKNVEAAENTIMATRLELETEIVRRFIAVAATEEKISLLDSILRIAESTHDRIQSRLDAGAAKMTDLIRAEIAIEQLLLERDALVSEKKQMRRRFAALGGKQAPILEYCTGSIDDSCPIPSLDTLKSSLDDNPELKSVDIERLRLAVERQQRAADVVPDLTISAGYLRNNPDKSNSPLLGLSMRIPLFDRNIGAQRQITLQEQACGERRENLRGLLYAETEAVYGSLVDIDNRISTLSGSTIPRAERVYTMMQEYYDAGKAAFLDLSVALADVLHLRMNLYDLQTERAQQLVNISHLTSLNIQIVK